MPNYIMDKEPASLTSALHYAAAGLYFATIPKHTHVGLYQVQPAVEDINDSRGKIKRLLAPTWLHSNVFLAMSGIYQYSHPPKPCPD